jgi:hypothetical protein
LRQKERRYPSQLSNSTTNNRSNRAARMRTALTLTKPAHLAGNETSSPFFVPVLSQVPESPDSSQTGRSGFKSTFICVSGISGKSNQRWVVGTCCREESCPLSSHFIGVEVVPTGSDCEKERDSGRESILRFGFWPGSLAASGRRISTCRPPSGRFEAFTVPP